MTKIQLFEEEFNKKYTDLVSKGYSPSSPEMIELFKYKAQMQIKLSKEENSNCKPNKEVSSKKQLKNIRSFR